ncbi:MAG TPA: TonB-dependent receptor [Woeseiaceae bacterium]|nr:TonB-dependent receptor [Woeseiaceae bacterium]
MSPVDVLSGSAVQNQASFDLTESLTRIAPSLNTQRYPIADGTALIRPVSLRNLSPDHTLVLMNGTRRHRSALVNLQLAPLGTVNQGSQAVDWAAFPAAAIERVEILRDGASAQYGSDAIAGVVNVILKDDSSGFSASGQYGETYDSEGERFTVSANLGLPLTDTGFLNLTAEYSDSDITDRGVPRPDAQQVAGFVGVDQVPLNGFGQRWGDPAVEALKLLVNAGIDVSDTTTLYGFATFMDNETVSDFFYRTPVLTDPAQQLEVAARTTLQIDGNPDDPGNLPDGLPDAADQALVASIIGQGLDPADYLVPVGDVPGATSASGFVLRNPIWPLFPGGYNPDFGADISDFSIVVGARGEFSPALTWDVNGRFAENEVEYVVGETINPSLGRLSPTEFRPGTLTQEESSVQADFVKTFDGSPLNIAFGGGWRNETYKIGAGDTPSIQAGPTAAIFGVGSDGFQGFPTESAGSFDSDSIFAYVDFETDFTDQFSASLALRAEDYDEFDNTFDFKIAGRYDFTEQFALRATVNTGFRAPTPGQVNTLNITTTSDATGALIPNGTYPVDNPVAIALGAVPLEPEESTSFTAGAIFTPNDAWSFTADVYFIEIEDRLALLNNTIEAGDLQALLDAGVPSAEANLLIGTNANFFVNGFKSEVSGLDLAATNAADLWGGTLLSDFRYNHNEQEVKDVRAGTINQSRVFDLENQIPENRAVLTFDYSRDMFGGLLRFNYYDGWATTGGLFSPGDASDQYEYGSSVLVDLELKLTLADNYTVTLGAENVFDELPDNEQEPVSQFLGVKYALTSPYGFNGGFYYLRLRADFK